MNLGQIKKNKNLLSRWTMNSNLRSIRSSIAPEKRNAHWRDSLDHFFSVYFFRGLRLLWRRWLRTRPLTSTNDVHLRPFPHHLCEWKPYLRTCECQRIKLQDTTPGDFLSFSAHPLSGTLFLLFSFSPFLLRRYKKGTSCPNASRVP